MKRIALTSLAALFVVACQDGGVPTPPELEEPSFAILDGSRFSTVDCTEDDPCYHFFFLTPLVPTPKKFNGDFNPYVSPTVYISDVTSFPAGELLDEPSACVSDDTTRVFSSADVDAGNERFRVNWQTSEDNLTPDNFYRVCVKVGQIALGYRDIEPVESGAEIPRNPEQKPILQFMNGSNLPIKFRIEKGVLCRNDDNCGEMALDPNGGSFATNTGLAGMYVPNGSLDGTYNLVVEEVTCPLDEHGNVRFLPIDIPQFPGCYEVYAAEGSVTFGPEDLATVGVCFNETEVAAAMAVAAQVELLQIHHMTAAGTIEALPNVPAPAGVSCPTSGASANSGWLRNFARGVRKVLNPWFSPPPLAASHKGFGGEGMEEASPLVWALPAKMEIVQPPGGVGTGLAGLPLDPDPTVKITDELHRPVQNATLRFAITEPSSAPQSNIAYLGPIFAGWTGAPSPYITSGTLPLPRAISDANGEIAVEWTLAEANPNTLTATGVAVGPGAMFTIHDDTEKSFPGTGVLTFTAEAIDPYFDPEPPSGDLKLNDQGTAKLENWKYGFQFKVCAVPGFEITSLVAVKNNGDPVTLGELPDPPDGPWIIADDEDCFPFPNVTINKTGAYRLVVNGEYMSQKFNVRPYKK